MGIENLVTRSDGDVIEQDWFNLFNRVVQGDFIGRDSSGAATPGQNLGTPTVPWGALRVGSLIIDGQTVDVSSISAPPNRVLSGAVRVTSDFPDYLRPAGPTNGLNFDLTATAVNLSLDVNGTNVVFNADTNVTGLTAAPTSGNTCLINDTTLTGGDFTKILGEGGSEITVDSMGSEIADRIGQFVALLNTTSGELMLVYVESATKLTNAKRGFFINSVGSPVKREPLNNNETLQLMSLGFVFADENASTLDVSFRNPVLSENEPASPQTGDYWYDLGVNQWKRFNGSSYVSINRTFIGHVTCNDADCIGVRPEYFRRSYSDLNTFSVIVEDADTLRTNAKTSAISVYGSDLFFDFNFVKWSAASSFESGVTRTASTTYYLYVTEDGDPKISDQKPFEESSFMRGLYHPFESWRFVSTVFNNASDDFVNFPKEQVVTQQGNGHGSTNTRIRRWSTLAVSVGQAVTYSDSATDGASYTINKAGFYSIWYIDGTGVSIIGLSRNSTQLTTNANDINPEDCLGFERGNETTTNYAFTVSWSGYLEIGDVIRPHTDGTPANTNASQTRFTITLEKEV